MNCSKCGNGMVLLLVSWACDHCDGKVPTRSPAVSGATNAVPSGTGNRQGYVVWRQRHPPAKEYVFSNRAHAEQWRTVQGLAHCDIRQVETRASFRWRTSAGTIKGLEMADHLIEVYADEKYPDGPHRAHWVA